MLAADHKTVDGSAAIALMSVDMEKIATGLIWIHQGWGSLVEIGLFVWILERQLHLAIVASTLSCLCKKGSFRVFESGD